MKFRQRSAALELLDEDNIPFADIKQNMKELDFINTYLGGHAITIEGFKTIAAGKKQVSVCEIGCGGGDNLAAIARYAAGKKIELHCIGIDIKQACIEYAKESQQQFISSHFITSDYREIVFEQKPDIIFSSLFCHHFTKSQLVQQLQWMKENSSIGFFVNDLQRHPLAYYSIKLLTAGFSRSYLVKHDAPLSVLRGFRKSELSGICQQAGIQPVKLQWQWAFRYLLTYRHGS